MSSWLQSATERGASVRDWLSPRRQDSLALLRQSQWPSRKTEAWKYIPIDTWARAELDSVTAQSEPTLPPAIADLNSIDIVFINGVLQSGTLPSELPEGLRISALQDGNENMAWALDSFAAVKPQRHLFGLVNDVLATGGVIVDVAAGARIEKPLRIVHCMGAGSEAHTRLLVRIGESASLSVVEQFSGDQLSQSTGFAEYLLGSESRLEHYRFALQGGASMSVGGSHFDLSGGAQLVSNVVAFGSALTRLDVDINHRGEGARADMNAIYLLDGKELFDLHSNIEHGVPACTSQENVRGIVADNSRAVFNGRIHIHRDAQKTLAELNNRNLLLSPRSEIDTKPELEIYADDVRCAHGATIAEIDQKAMYYLLSRGISRKQAQVMLSFGFINELVDEMPSSAIAEWLRPQLRERFAAMEIKSWEEV